MANCYVGSSIGSSYAAIDKVASVTIAADQPVMMTGHAAIGAGASAANNLNLMACWVQIGTVHTVCSGLYGLSVAANQRMTFGIDHVFTGLAAAPTTLASGPVPQATTITP